jgi:nicotinamide-nucleotide amidase
LSDLSNSQTLTSIAQQLGEMLCKKNAKLTTAESCTGGGISEAITAVSGSSQWFEFGFVTYANSAKQQLLGVSKEALDEYGAVSEQVVKQMAQGAIKQSQADYAIAVSGIAGPDGGTQDKPSRHSLGLLANPHSIMDATINVVGGSSGGENSGNKKIFTTTLATSNLMIYCTHIQ